MCIYKVNLNEFNRRVLCRVKSSLPESSAYLVSACGRLQVVCMPDVLTMTHEKETFDLCDLRPGDHIVQQSLFGLATTFWHHMIVENIDEKQINVIHYYHDLEPLWKFPSVCRTSLTFTPDRYV